MILFALPSLNAIIKSFGVEVAFQCGLWRGESVWCCPTGRCWYIKLCLKMNGAMMWAGTAAAGTPLLINCVLKARFVWWQLIMSIGKLANSKASGGFSTQPYHPITDPVQQLATLYNHFLSHYIMYMHNRTLCICCSVKLFSSLFLFCFKDEGLSTAGLHFWFLV